MRSIILRLAVLVLFIVVSAAYAADYLTEGRSLEKSEDFAGAVEIYLRGIDEQPSADLYLAAGRLLGKMKKYDRGDALLQKALEKFPTNQALAKLAALFRSRTGRDSAVTVAVSSEPSSSTEEVFEPLPEGQQASAAVEIILELQKTDPREIAVHEKALQQIIFTCPASEYSPEACWKLANLYLYADNQPDYQKALPMLDKIVSDYPDSSVAGSSLTRMRSIAEATGNYALLLKTAQQAQKLKIWNSEEQNFWVCHEAAGMIGNNDREGGLAKLRQIATTAESTPRAAEYATFLLENL